jgi:hypothetical protein
MYRTSGPERYSPHFRRVAGLRIDLRSVVVTKGMIRAAYFPHAVACCRMLSSGHLPQIQGQMF